MGKIATAVLGMMFANLVIADTVVTDLDLRLICNVTTKTTLITPKGLFEEANGPKDVLINVTVTHLQSSPSRRLLKIKAVGGGPYLYFETQPLFEQGKQCSINRNKTCRAEFTDKRIEVSESTGVDSSTQSQERATLTIDRTTGLLFADFSTNEGGLPLQVTNTGNCKKAPEQPKF